MIFLGFRSNQLLSFWVAISPYLLRSEGKPMVYLFRRFFRCSIEINIYKFLKDKQYTTVNVIILFTVNSPNNHSWGPLC